MIGRRIGFLIVRFTATALLGLFCVSAWAQRGGVSVKMNLTDSRTGEAVGFATVSLTVEGSDKPYKYVVSTSEGDAEITGVRDGKYVLKVEMMSYKTYEETIEVAGKDINLGKVKIHPDAQRLNAATVTDIGNPIIVKKDTIEYNASSFKTTDNDMLEDLLKKLPGVEVGTDGSVTANGETISKITIDGKTFFLDDPQLATKNIPAKIVEKVKVVEKKSDQAIFTGIDDGEEETVIDLSIQRGMMNGWFGNVMGGGGHDMPDKGYYKSSDESWQKDGWRYQGAAMVGRFTDASQLSLILNGNNTNNRGFNDMAGNMMQNMRGGRGMGRGTGGWGSNNGVTSSWMTGVNGVFNLLDGRMDLGGNYVYNGSDKYIEEDSHKITYMDDGSSLDYTSKGTNITDSQGHRFGVRLEHYFTESTSILFEPQVNFGHGYFHEYSQYTTYTDPGTGAPEEWTNEGFTETKGWNKNWSTSGFLLFRQRLGKPGRTISVNVRYDFSGNKMDGYNQSLTSVQSDEDADERVDEFVNQRYHSVSNASSIEARAVYTEPIATNFFLELNYSYSWNQNKSTKDTYDSSSNGSEVGDDGRTHLTYNSTGESPNPYYSSYITNKYQNHNAGADFIYQKDKFRAQLGAAFRPTITDNETNGETYHSSVMNWSPQAMISYDFGENSNVRFFYFGRSEQPSTSQLMPVADNSDPLNISFGNPYLEPYFTHRLRGRFAYTNKETFTSVHAGLGGSLIQNTVTNAMWYDSNGTQYAMPLNGKNSGSVDLRVMVNSPFARSKFSIFNMSYISYSNSTSYVGKTEGGMGDQLINDYYDAVSGTLDYELFHNDFFGDDPTKNFHDYFTDSKTQTLSFTERLRFTYRSDLVEINVGGRTRMSKSWYSITEYNQSPNWDNQVELSMNWTIPGGVGLMAEGRYNWYNGYTTKQDDEIIFNAEISKLLFKNRFTLALKAYDIFNQSKNMHVTDETNYHQETRNNTLGRYIMLSLTFRFGKFNGGGNNRGPGGPGGPGGPPGGFGGPPRR
ncbi:MAG: outer membrane beta-barrel protein [Bacteroidales bacterium]|nr:outer membrane beta-barrel protein [Bacteroidales bacterium]